MNEDMEAVHDAASHLPTTNDTRTTTTNATNTNSSTTSLARKLTKTILDQSHLSPFPLSLRPVLWDYASCLSIYPLPTALVLCDAEAPQFCITYEGCHVMNAGSVLDQLSKRKGGAGGVGGGVGRWIEYDVKKRRGCVRDLRF
jgi:DNA polymerase epsilon subunit 2